MNGDEKKDQNVNDPGNGGFERGRISIHSVRARVVLLFAVAVGLIIALLRVDFVNKFVTGAFSLLSPVIIGVTLAYVLNPVCNFFRRIFYKAFTKNEKRSKEKAKKHARRLSIFITVFLLLAIIAALLFLIVPELTDSVSKLVSNIPEMLKSASSWIKNNLPSETVLGINFSATVEKFID
ncbi:MAG: AI-2E family transporter, partial [Clostridia bacterium]|nr:AI-2E family transporter [Clostridia bacterium]